MKKLSKINEGLIGNMWGRAGGTKQRKEDSLELKLKNFIDNNDERNEEDYYIKDNKVCCKGKYVFITDEDLIDGKFPFQFGEIGRNFNCSDCKSLTTLEGVPQEIEGNFNCRDCTSLTTLEGAPQKVGEDFICSYCKSLTTLEGAPQIVGGFFYCGGCTSLTSLEGAPQKVGDHFLCSDCTSLTSLEGAPQNVGGNFLCLFCGKKFTKEDLPKNTIIKGIFKC